MTRDYLYDPELTPFDASATGYNPENALWLATAANLAYEGEDTIRSVVGQWGFDRFSFLHARGKMEAEGRDVPVDTEAYVCTGSQASLVAFRGTEPKQLTDWFTDLMIRTVPAASGKGKTHKGFTAAFTAVWPQLQQALAEQRTGQQPIWVTGHSLGGALAVLAVAQLQLAVNVPVQGLYTFGQPRTSDRDFARALNQAIPGRALRFINDKDVVPQLPPPGLLLKYWHIDQAAHFDSEGNLTFDVSGWTRLLSLVRGSTQDLGKLDIDALKDHAMDQYVALARKQTSASG